MAKRPKSKPAPPATISETIDVPGARPAVFKLVERGKESYFLYRSSRKLGTARVEEKGEWSARIGEGKIRFIAAAKAGTELLRLVGTYLLAQEVREAVRRPVEEANPRAQHQGQEEPRAASLDRVRQARPDCAHRRTGRAARRA